MREDLLRDARGLVPRVKLRVMIGGREREVFAGFRGESLSLYFDDDPVYHFNARGELRRAFVNDRLVKAERGQLIVLKRKQSRNESVLERQPHDATVESQFLSRMSAELADLASAIADGRVQLLGQSPTDGDALGSVAGWLQSHPWQTIAYSPRVGG
jgi:hypothetical protein